MTTCILHQQDRRDYSLGFNTKNLASCSFSCISFACGAFFSSHFNLVYRACDFSHWFSNKQHYLSLWFQCLLSFTDSIVLKNIRISILSDHNDLILEKQQWRKCHITKLLSDQTSWGTNRTTTNQFQNSLSKSTYVITCNRGINITTTWLVFILLHFHAVSSHLLLNPWHSNDLEPKGHLILLESKLHFCPASCPWPLPTPSTHHIPWTVTIAQKWILTETVDEKRFYWHNPSQLAWPW